MSFLIFTLTLLCIYIRPFRLPLWVYSSLGAFLCLGFGVVGFADVAFVWNMVWDSTLTLVGLIIFCIVLEKLLFFDFLAYKILKFLSEKGECGVISSFKFYVFIVLFGGFLGAFFANDGAILILTPLIIALFGKLDSKDMESKLDSKNSAQILTPILTPLVIFLLIVSFVSDFASNTFVISNLTNIIALHFFNLNALDFSKVMALPQIFIIIATLCFFILVRKRLPRILRVKIPNTESHTIESSTTPQQSVIIICFALLFLLLCGIFIANAFSLPLSSFTLLCAFLSLILAYKRIEILPCLKASPFGIVVFSLGLFIVVFGLHSTHSFMRDIFAFFLDDSLSDSFSTHTLAQIFSVGAISSLGSSLINNLPMVMLGNLALSDFVGLGGLDSAFLESKELLIYAHLLGCNVGAKLTPIGSLATLLWLFSLKRYGIYISFWQYMLVAMLVVPFMLCMGLLGLLVYVGLHRILM
ncbi:arsenic transporter [Helicobacter bilis]|uniref:Arsenic transporter n=1 Tax=Helicobacter bilis TaxID=37372 RepID=A0A4U8UAV8_9HELI|nr:arsenic transporter [Helicobacter bilis]TLE09711.1 arsenic transporter [Helicobacter bilis]TLE12204.1 arsenic transporter [Helicobacter bilis]